MTTKKILGRWDSVAISIGIVVGVGIFRVPSEIAQQLQSPSLILAAWLLGALISFAGALCYAELVCLYPESGGDYVYLRQAYGKLTGFLFAWSELLITRTGSVAAVALLFGEYGCSLFDIDLSFASLLAIGVVITLSAVNLYGLRIGSRLQNVLTVIKMLALTGIIISGFATAGQPQNSFALKGASFDFTTITALAVALVPILWTYGGWRDNVFLAGETKEAHRAIPFALLSTCFIVASIYMAMNVLYLWRLPMEQIVQSKLIATDLLLVLFGTAGARAVELIIVVLSFSVINALLLTGSRIAHAMGEDNRFFFALSKVDEKTDTPRRALLFNCIWACLLIVVTGQFEKLIYFTGLAVWIFFAMVTVAIIILRRRKNKDQKDVFRTPLYPLTPIVVALVSLALAAGTIKHEPYDAAIGTAIVLAGIPLFYLQKRRKD